MAGNRITWQNVDAPDFSAALQAASSGGEAFSGAMDKVSGLLGGIDASKKAALTATAIDKLMTYQDTEAWDKATGTSALAALGLAPGQADADMMKLIYGRRDDLEQDRTIDQQAYTNSYNQGRTEIIDGRADVDYNRKEEDYQRGLWAQAEADKMVTGTVSREDAVIAARERGLDVRQEEALIQAITNANEAHWSTRAGHVIGDEALRLDIAKAGYSLDEQERELNLESQNNKAVQLYQAGLERYGEYGTALDGLFETLGAEVSDENKEAFGSSKGRVTSTFNRIKENNPGLPDAVIVAAMEDNLRQTGMLRGLTVAEMGSIDIDERGVNNILADLATPENRAALNQQLSDYASRTETITRTRSEISRLEGELLTLTGNGGSAAEIQKRKDKIRELASGISSIPNAGRPSEAPAPATGDPVAAPVEGDAEAIIEEAAAEPVSGAERIDNVRGGIGNAVGSLGRGVDWALGQTGGIINDQFETLQEMAGWGVGMVSPAAGGYMLDRSAARRQNNREMRQNGLFGTAAPAAEAPAETPPAKTEPTPQERVRGERLVEQARFAPTDTIQLVAAETEMPPAVVDQASQAMSLLADGSAPATVKSQARAQLKAFVEEARLRADASSPEVRALIESAEEWLGL